jgi:Orsellinic acid/F9775 biosynthesis cluster protein D
MRLLAEQPRISFVIETRHHKMNVLGTIPLRNPPLDPTRRAVQIQMPNSVNTSSAEQETIPGPVLPDQLKPYLTILDKPLGLPVCIICQNAVLPRSLMDHLRKQHQLPANLRSVVRYFVSTLPALDVSDLPSDWDGYPPNEALRVVEAFQCKHCRFIRQDLTDVRKHINKEHGISASGSYDEIQAQSWLGGRRALYWRVEVCIADGVKEGPQCIWGLFGKGWGDKTPRSWPSGSEDLSSVLKD